MNDGDMNEKTLSALGLVGGPWGLCAVSAGCRIYLEHQPPLLAGIA